MRLAGCRLDGLSGHEAGRQLLQRLYFEETGKSLPGISISEWGNPHFADNHLFFSITHTKYHAFCALSQEAIGIDAEELTRPVHLRLAKRILSQDEFLQFQQAENQQKALLTFWVLKEAAAKLSGLGLRGFPNHTHFSLDDPRVQELDGCLVAILTASDGKDIPINKGCLKMQIARK